MHSNDFENEFENEPLFAPISQNELTPEAVSDSLKEAEKGGGEGGIEISGENMLERGKEIEAIIANNYVESVMKIQLAEFIAPQDVANPTGNYLCLHDDDDQGEDDDCLQGDNSSGCFRGDIED